MVAGRAVVVGMVGGELVVLTLSGMVVVDGTSCC